MTSPLKLQYQGSVADKSIDEIIASFHVEKIKISPRESKKIYLWSHEGYISSVDVPLDEQDIKYTSQQFLGYVFRNEDKTLEVRLKDKISEKGEHMNSLWCTIKTESPENLAAAASAMKRLYRGNHGRY